MSVKVEHTFRTSSDGFSPYWSVSNCHSLTFPNHGLCSSKSSFLEMGTEGDWSDKLMLLRYGFFSHHFNWCVCHNQINQQNNLQLTRLQIKPSAPSLTSKVPDQNPVWCPKSYKPWAQKALLNGFRFEMQTTHLTKLLTSIEKVATENVDCGSYANSDIKCLVGSP